MLDQHGGAERFAHYAILILALGSLIRWAAATRLRTLQHARHKLRLAYSFVGRPLGLRRQQQIAYIESLHDRIILVGMRRRCQADLQVRVHIHLTQLSQVLLLAASSGLRLDRVRDVL